jgi:hypothetical protein
MRSWSIVTSWAPERSAGVASHRIRASPIVVFGSFGGVKVRGRKADDNPSIAPDDRAW